MVAPFLVGKNEGDPAIYRSGAYTLCVATTYFAKGNTNRTAERDRVVMTHGRRQNDGVRSSTGLYTGRYLLFDVLSVADTPGDYPSGYLPLRLLSMLD